jgi:hypothetical protein
MWWNVRARFTVGDYAFREIDITPALGIAFLAGITLLIAHTTWS